MASPYTKTQLNSHLHQVKKMTKIRPQYEELGVEGYYTTHGSSYRNPHEKQIHVLLETMHSHLDLSSVLDLACGSGEVSIKLLEKGATVSGIDPFTQEAYLARTGLIALNYSFEDIAAGSLEGQVYSLVVCSFAMHLCEISRLPNLCYQLAQISPKLFVVSPHKRPVLKPEWGWQLEVETSFERVKARLFTSVFRR
jgi:2-polyprenyl-3-methyl-5-hydroxy-6-metoxy-1,4-benzoquinol methylase